MSVGWSGEQFGELQIYAVGPTEIDHIVLVAGFDGDLRIAGDHIVFLTDRAVAGEAAVDRREELTREGLRVVMKTVAVASAWPCLVDVGQDFAAVRHCGDAGRGSD